MQETEDLQLILAAGCAFCDSKCGHPTPLAPGGRCGEGNNGNFTAISEEGGPP